MTLKQKLVELDINLDDLFYERINNFILLLKQWGKIHNLTAKLDDENINKNIIDSLYPLKFLKEYDNIADVGTGAGFPGLVLAIAMPNKKFTLIEPRKKRASFLSFVKNYLELLEVSVVDKRVEELKDTLFDLIVSRAVTNTSLLLELSKNISNEKTSYLFYKGSLLPVELKEARLKEYDVINNSERNYLYINNKG